MAVLTIPESTIRRHGPGNALAVCWRQWRAERNLARRGLHFRGTDPAAVAAAYAAMTQEEFDAVNGRQDWANWRTIPRCLSGHVSDQPLRVLDLGCGTGGSTQALAFYCPAGSHITGYEFAEPLLTCARRRRYVQMKSGLAQVDFVCQGVTEALLDAAGKTLVDGSVNVVNASGVVGHHLNPTSIDPLLQELQRLLTPDGIAMLDVGPTLRQKELVEVMGKAGFTPLGHFRSWWFDPTGQVVFRRRD